MVVIPHRGRRVDSLWWRCYDNPSEGLVSLYYWLIRASRIGRRSFAAGSNKPEMKFSGRLAFSYSRKLGRILIKPAWRKSIWGIMEKEADVDAVIFFSIGLNHLRGLARNIKRVFGVPTVYFEADTPRVLPQYNPSSQYLGADLSEYDAFLSVSKGSTETLKELGALRAEAFYFGADPSIFRPFDVDRDIDIFFPGYGKDWREDWVDALLVTPLSALRNLTVGVTGRMSGLPGRVINFGSVPFETYRRLISRGKIGLNIFRKPFCETYGSSSTRLFELASSGACIVTNPALGLEEWFEPGRELFVADSAKSAVELYENLLSDEGLRRRTGEAARARVLREHTYSQRAEWLVNFLKSL